MYSVFSLMFFTPLWLQVGPLCPIAADGAGDGDVSEESHRWHTADHQPHGEGEDGVPRRPALDEGRLPGAGPRHVQTAGEVPQGLVNTRRWIDILAPLAVFGLLLMQTLCRDDLWMVKLYNFFMTNERIVCQKVCKKVRVCPQEVSTTPFKGR